MEGVSGVDAAWSDWPSRYLVEPGLWVQPFGAPHFAPGRGALFLDRDGVVIEDTGYPSDIATIVLRDSVVSVMREANEAGVPVVIVTNQSGVARGYFSWVDFAAVTAHIAAELAARSAHADLLIACGYLAGGKPPLDVADHPARKPGPDEGWRGFGFLCPVAGAVRHHHPQRTAFRTPPPGLAGR